MVVFVCVNNSYGDNCHYEFKQEHPQGQILNMAKEKAAAKNKASNVSTYTEDDITGFTRDLEKIQAKPTMYIGELDQAGINTIIREPCDNGVDEARAGRNNLIHIIVNSKDGSYWVRDEGVGIPVGMHKKMKISTLTHVLTNLQSSGKMSGDAYKSAIGTHGVGIKATNALSKELEVWTYRKEDGGWHHTKFVQGVEKSKVKKSDAPKLPTKQTPKLGTIMRFVPDERFFGKHKADLNQLRAWCEMTSYMNVGLKIILTIDGKNEEWLSKRGIAEYLEKRLEKLKATPMSKKHVFVNSETLELAIFFADVEGSEMEFFTNTIRNIEEGVHADDMYKALVEALKPHKGKLTYTPTDLKEGLVGVLNYKINAPQFDSQTKEKLVDNRVKGACYEECLKEFNAFFKENKSLAKQIVERAAELRKKTAEFLKDKKLIKKVKGAQKGLAAKLADCSGKTPIEQRELYLVEGDSAGGTAKVARDRTFQATFALKGKPLNVMETTKDKVNGNAEIAGIFAGIGLDLSKANPIDHIQFGKIIFLADPDVDGCHINTLLMTLFWKYLPDLFKQGRIYMLEAPEYMAKHKDKIYFGPTPKHIQKQAGTDKLDIRHIKGWGELDAEDMTPIAFDVNARRMFRILPPRDKNGILQFQALMGKKAIYRQKLLGVISDEEAKAKSAPKAKAAKKAKVEVEEKTKGTTRKTKAAAIDDIAKKVSKKALKDADKAVAKAHSKTRTKASESVRLVQDPFAPPKTAKKGVPKALIAKPSKKKPAKKGRK